MYNFDKKVDRSNTNAMKLEGYKQYIFGADESMQLPFESDEFIHMWVADMEFEVAPEILDAIKDRVDRKILGYTANYDNALYDAVTGWCRDRYDWTFARDEMVISDGVIPALETLFSYIVGEDEKLLFQTPAYGQFALAADRVGKEYDTTSLIKNADGTYDMDFEALDQELAREDISLFVFCSPHNPTGRAWTEDELEKLAKIIKKHDVWVISDEIHCDLRRKDAPRHIPLAKVMGDYDKIITCMAASKTFNIAGLKQSCIVIKNDDLRARWENEDMGLLNPLSHEATIAAYTKGGAWLDALTDYLDDNFRLMHEYIVDHLPEAIITPSETTYLGWVDLSAYFEEDEDVELFFATVAGVLIEADKTFVDDANGIIRLNLACPRAYLKEGLERIADAILNKHDEKFMG